MARTKNPRKSKTPGSKFDTKLDLITGLERSEKFFQARMTEIFLKYDRPFVNDIVINIENLTYATSDGQRPWKFQTFGSENGRSEDSVSKDQIREAEDSEETQSTQYKKSPFVKKSQGIKVSCDSSKASFSHHSKKKLSTTSDVEQYSGRTCTTLKQYEENPYANDHKEIVATHNRDSSISKKIHVASPFKASHQVNGLIDKKDKDCLSECAGRCCEVDDSGPPDYKEAGNNTLVHVYPQMFNNLCSLWELQLKNQAAGNIVRHYKRLMWCKQKVLMKTSNRNVSMSVNKTYTICPAPKVEEIVTAPETCDSKLLHKSGIGDAIKVPSLRPFSQVHKLQSAAVPVTLPFDSLNIADKTFEIISDNWTTYMHSPFPGQKQKEINGVVSTGYSSRAFASLGKMSIGSTKRITNNSQMDVDSAQLQDCTDSKPLQRNIRPMRMLQSPSKVVAKSNCSISLSKIMTIKSQMELDDRNHASYKEHNKQLPNSTLIRRNSFSTFPVSHSANQDFESLYRNLSLDRPRTVFSLGKGQVQLSKTVSSLVNSPGSLRAKRQQSQDISFSMSKKPRSISEALIGSSKPSSPSTNSDELLWSEHSPSTLQHLQMQETNLRRKWRHSWKLEGAS